MQNLTRTATVNGTQAVLVSIECTTTSGFAGQQMVGNISDLCRDGKERAKTVLENLGYKMGHKRILINFAPSDCKKEGNHFDLPIAMSLAALLGSKDLVHNPKDWLFAAELGLDGSLRPTRGIVPLILTAIEHGLNGVVVAEDNADEMLALQQVAKLHGKNFRYLCFRSLADVLNWAIEGLNPPSPAEEKSPVELPALSNFDDMYLTEKLQRLAVCFASGRHSLLLRGTPGCGKSMFAQRLPSLLPLLSEAIHLDALRIHSLISDRIPVAILRGHAPFRQPHHSTHPLALLGTAETPGELSLAHGGVLFLDELPEFRRDLLEALREPLETGHLFISRAQKKSTWKSRVQLVAACNECPCGYTGSKRVECLCSNTRVMAYTSKMSGPLLERIDMHFHMPELKPSLFAQSVPKQSGDLLGHVARSRNFMHERWGSERNNSEASLEDILECSRFGDQKRQSLMEDMEKMKISSRSTLRLLRVARTLADMDLNPSLESKHIMEAAALRP